MGGFDETLLFQLIDDAVEFEAHAHVAEEFAIEITLGDETVLAESFGDFVAEVWELEVFPHVSGYATNHRFETELADCDCVGDVGKIDGW